MFAHKIHEQSEHDVSDVAETAAAPTVAEDGRGADGAAVGGADESPARALQERLKTALEAPAEMSSRRVAAMFLVVCLSCWVAGIGLYALL